MNPIRNNKLCWNCEGSVHPHAIHCPYCGVSLTTREPAETESIARSYAINTPRGHTGGDIPAPPYNLPQGRHESGARDVHKEEWREAIAEEENTSGGFLTSFLAEPLMPIVLLLPGIVLFLFGLMLVAFSSQGVLTLEWSAKYWFVYLLLAAPLLYFGWRILGTSSADEEES